MIDTEKLYVGVGTKIREIRNSRTRRITQQELANLLGVERTSITNIEKGRQRLPLHLVYSLCDLLSLDLSDVLPDIESVKVDETELSELSIGQSKAEAPSKTKSLIERLGE